LLHQVGDLFELNVKLRRQKVYTKISYILSIKCIYWYMFCIEEMIPTFSGACYGVRSTVPNSTINALKSVYYANFYSIKNMEQFLVVTLPTVGRRSLYSRKSSELWLVHNSRTSCRSLIKNLQILPVPGQYILTLKKFIINNQKIFKTNLSIQN
jgi:hypothetical protein